MVLERLQIEVADFIKVELVKELEAKGHNTTGRLSKSIEVETMKFVDGFVIDGKWLRYGSAVDKGRKPGGKKVPIDALYLWIRAKKIDLRGKSALSVAYAIQNSIHAKGIKASRWASGTLERIEGNIEARIRDIIEDFVTIEFDNMIENMQKEFNSTTIAA